ncbi:MAG: NAD(P)H-dependent oxidoreductase subunit E [Proteobacteria bacterium]|nr:NAD(P)H-dependent oxidoreductase subunit E [Pseudomonadota bacterium]MBU2480524.1 NAD(P)H-dependent oxidoreductase subunit E [Pseudomonadota bacterium]
MSNMTAQQDTIEQEIDYLVLDQMIEKDFNGDKENLIMILQAIQRQYNYLPRPALLYVSEKLAIPYSKIYEVGTFYSTFSLEPRGRNIISICLGTACHVRGAEPIKEKIESTLDLKDDVTTKDMRYTLESVRCIGCCSLGPVIKINEDMHGRIKPDEIETVLNQYE